MFKSDRRGRASRLVDPAETQKTLLKFHEAANYGHDSSQLLQRQGNRTSNKTSIIIIIIFKLRNYHYGGKQQGTCLICHNRNSVPALPAVQLPVVVSARRGTILQHRYTVFHWLPASLSLSSKNSRIFSSKSSLRFASEYNTLAFYWRRYTDECFY